MPYRTLREILRRQDLLHVTPATPTLTTAQRMAERNVGAVLVLDQGDLRGIFTERDLLRRVVAEGLDPAKTPISDAMTTETICIDGGRTGFEAVRLMHERDVRHIVVMGLDDPGYGIVSVRDFPPGELAAFHREIEFEERVWEEI